MSTVGCESGAVYVYDSLYKSPTKELIHLIASMIHSQSNELKITMMDVKKQSNGSDCGVLAIAYVFDLCSGFDPAVQGLMTVGSGFTWLLALKIATFLVFLY